MNTEKDRFLSISIGLGFLITVLLQDIILKLTVGIYIGWLMDYIINEKQGRRFHFFNFKVLFKK